MKARGIRNEYALVPLLAEATRKAVSRWRKRVTRPGPEWRPHLATVLGGAPDDYATAPDVAELEAEIAALRSQQADGERRLAAAERQLSELRASRDDGQ